MRCSIDVARDPGDRLVGWLDLDGTRMPFSGVLELVTVLERAVDTIDGDDADPSTDAT